MESFIIAFNVVMPLFMLVGLGYFVKKVGVVSETSLKELNSLVFKIFLPMLLFNNMYKADFNEKINFELIVYAVISILVFFTILCVIVPKVEKEKSKITTVIQGIYRSNFALFGIAVTGSMYGEENIGTTGILVAIIVPMFNVLAVCLFEIGKGDGVKPGKLLKGIIRNPLIIGTVLGIAFRITGIVFPEFIGQMISTTGNLATPVALIVLGGTFSFIKLVDNKVRLIVICFMRLIVIPLIFVTFSLILGYRNRELFALYLMFGSPTAVASFAMASEMGGDSELAGQIVVLTTVLSLISYILWIFIMRYFAFV